jgi:hypothetical protein
MARSLAPISSTLKRARVPSLCSAIADVERSLSAHRGQESIGPLALYYLGHPFRSDRLDVGPVGNLRVGHDRGWVGVHQDDPVSLFSQRANRLGSGVIELGSLTDDDRSGTEQQNRTKVSPFGH